MTARDQILARIRVATADVPADEPVSWDPERDVSPADCYRRAISESDSARLKRLALRLSEHGAQIVTVADDPGAVAEAVGSICTRRGIASIVTPARLPGDWVPSTVFRIDDAPSLSYDALAMAECVLTGAALAVADSGTIVLDAGDTQGRRVLTLVPDVHLCVVRATQVVGSVPEAVRHLAQSARAGRQITLISGPSATSDIAFERVVGVHGPRHLEVILLSDTGGRDVG